MKRLTILAATLGLLAMGVPALAVSTNTMAVSAAVTGTCLFNSGTSTLNFGTLDQTLSTDATATATTTFWCTKGTAYTITNDSGLYGTAPTSLDMQNSTDSTLMPYSIAYTSTGTGSGKTTPLTLTVTGTVLNADYVAASAGSYADSVVITITP